MALAGKNQKEAERKDTLKRKSYGMQITKDRIALINKLYKFNTAVVVQDLTGDNGNASGTKITITIPIRKNHVAYNIKLS